MGKTWSVYIKDDDLNDAIDDALEGSKFHNQAHLFTVALEELLLKEDGPEELT